MQNTDYTQQQHQSLADEYHHPSHRSKYSRQIMMQQQQPQPKSEEPPTKKARGNKKNQHTKDSSLSLFNLEPQPIQQPLITVSSMSPAEPTFVPIQTQFSNFKPAPRTQQGHSPVVTPQRTAVPSPQPQMSQLQTNPNQYYNTAANGSFVNTNQDIALVPHTSEYIAPYTNSQLSPHTPPFDPDANPLQATGPNKNKLELQGQGLKTTMINSVQLDLMMQVTHSDYSNNEIDTIQGLGLFPYLNKLDLHSNKLQSLVGISEAKRVTQLNISHNYLINLWGMNQMNHLERMNCSNNQLIDLRGLDQAPKLKWIDISTNNLTSLIGIEKCPSLTYVDASNNDLVSLEGIQMCQQLTHLNIANNHMSSFDWIVTIVNTLPELIFLDLSGNQFSQDQIAMIQNLFYQAKPHCTLIL
eukprot:TRINITY_DN2093_c0_g1_i2.p1 TRINITY_DN2093_c0_g1~~TRINITY_DN2093_c0_g1_i2.p1  ORF type:complete len:412 (+),score=110.18 TRINITY_DN2093_c0_g1_i2:73-1308(+)